MSRATAAAALALALAVALTASAHAATYRGTAVGDPQMAVKLKLEGDAVTFSYTDVPVKCSDGSTPRQGGAEHLDLLNENRRFRDRVEGDGAVSHARGRVRPKRARGRVSFDLVYPGGECHSGEIEWRARRR